MMAKQQADMKKIIINVFKTADANNDTKVTKSEALKFYEEDYRRRMYDTLLKGKSEAEIKELVKKGFKTSWNFLLKQLKYPLTTVEISFNKFIKKYNEAAEREAQENA